MKAAIDLMCRKLAASEYSHQSSWAHLRANQLKNLGIACDVLDFDGPRHSRDWRDYDVIYIYHGMDFRPELQLNVFDGLVEHAAKFFERLIWPQHSHIKYVSMDIPMPDYGYKCKTRKGERSPYWEGVDWDAVSERCKQTTEWIKDPAITYGQGKITHICVGDSHTHSAYKPNSYVLRKDGRTMAGILKKGIKTEIEQYGVDFSTIESLTCYHGSIDVRHHLCREVDPVAAARELATRYEQHLLTLDKQIELVTILPIEDEARRIPKSGYYKNTPFYGTRAQRQEVLKVMNDSFREAAAKHPGWSIHEWPKYWYEIDGTEFMELYMEKPRSVHLARKYYRWDLVKNTPNELLEVKPKAKALLQFD